MQNKCRVCNNRYEKSMLIYEEDYETYICYDCDKELEDEQDKNKMLCEECEKYYNIEEMYEIEINREIIGHDYLCKECLEGWEEAIDQQNYEWSMNRFRRI